MEKRASCLAGEPLRQERRPTHWVGGGGAENQQKGDSPVFFKEKDPTGHDQVSSKERT